VSAYTTHFFISQPTTEFAATAIAHGATLLASSYTACHGTEGRGNGPTAKSLPTLPTI
jgi:hypothetical protein